MFLTEKCFGKQYLMGSFPAGTSSGLDAQPTSVIRSGRPFQKETPLHPTPNRRTSHFPLNLKGAQPASLGQMPNFQAVKVKQDSPRDSRWNKNTYDGDTEVLQGDRSKQSGLVQASMSFIPDGVLLQ